MILYDDPTEYTLCIETSNYKEFVTNYCNFMGVTQCKKNLPNTIANINFICKALKIEPRVIDKFTFDFIRVLPQQMPVKDLTYIYEVENDSRIVIETENSTIFEAIPAISLQHTPENIDDICKRLGLHNHVLKRKGIWEILIIPIQ